MNSYWHTAVEMGRRLDQAGIRYCVIKSYGGDPLYEDHNVDLVVEGDLWEAYHRVFAADFRTSLRDRIKNLLYERNKLMLQPLSRDYVKLHLHSNAGWHNLCFVSAEEILGRSIEARIDGQSVRIPTRELEARIFVLHVIFEQFNKNEWDRRFLTDQDYLDFARDFALPEEPMRRVCKADGLLDLRDLRPIWRRYYRVWRRSQRVTLWNRFLHWLFTLVQRYRRRRLQASGD